MRAGRGPRPAPGDRAERETLITQLDDSAVLAVAALRAGRRAHVAGPSEAFEALVVEELPTEFGGYGDPRAVAQLMMLVDRWGCVEVEPSGAEQVAAQLWALGGLRSRFYGSVYFRLDTAALVHTDGTVRLLGPEDREQIRTSDRRLGLSDAEVDFGADVLAGAVIDGRLVAQASSTARSAHHADIAVGTLEEYRGRGLATAAASAVARRLQQTGFTPVWSTGETNLSSRRVAEKLGFTRTGRRTYVIAERGQAPDGTQRSGSTT